MLSKNARIINWDVYVVLLLDGSNDDDENGGSEKHNHITFFHEERIRKSHTSISFQCKKEEKYKRNTPVKQTFPNRSIPSWWSPSKNKMTHRLSWSQCQSQSRPTQEALLLNFLRSQFILLMYRRTDVSSNFVDFLVILIYLKSLRVHTFPLLLGFRISWGNKCAHIVCILIAFVLVRVIMNYFKRIFIYRELISYVALLCVSPSSNSFSLIGQWISFLW